MSLSAFRGKGKSALVLAGGGARGAYEVGAIRGLAELGFRPDLVAGTSIGALNGAIVAQEMEMNLAAEMLGEVWARLGRDAVIRPDYTSLTNVAGNIIGARLLGLTRSLVVALGASAPQDRGLLDVSPIRQLLEDYVEPQRLRAGAPLWVAVTKLLTNFDFPFRTTLELIRAAATKDVYYIQPGQLDSDDELYKSLMASAALPVAYPSQSLRGQEYLDGGVVDNVPLAALASEGCTFAVVVHLTNGSLWDRRDEAYDGISVLEIRPSRLLYEPGLKGWLWSLIDFSPDRIAALRQHGYEDALRTAGMLTRAKIVQDDAVAGREKLLDTVRQVRDDPDFEF